jgi:hypothetical protein
MGRLVDLTGMRFGRLLVLKRGPNNPFGAPRWHCSCDCGKSTLSHGASLRSGRARSCGCLSADNARQRERTHGHTTEGVSRIYRIWSGMLSRCENPNTDNYHRYGKRGIKVCERWHKFENFFGGHGGAPIWQKYRSHKQRRRLRAAQLSLGHAERAKNQPRSFRK